MNEAEKLATEEDFKRSVLNAWRYAFVVADHAIIGYLKPGINGPVSASHIELKSNTEVKITFQLAKARLAADRA